MNPHIKYTLQWFALALAIVLVSLFLLFSNALVKNLGKEENSKMELWAEAYQQMFVADENADMSFQWQVICNNTTIPVFYTDAEGVILGYKNVELPFYSSWGRTLTESDTIAYLQNLIPELEEKKNVFEVEVMPDFSQRLYFDESILLQRLHFYPYVQLMAVIVLALLFYYMLISRKRAEQNRVWVGLSKETAHQLGTPIQSLMGWVEFFKEVSNNQDSDNIESIESMDSNASQRLLEEIQVAAVEMEKDVNRLHLVAERFSKIGSEPKLVPSDLRPIIKGVADYMQKRASKRIQITTSLPQDEVIVPVSAPLFAWVIENLCKNAIDAQDKNFGTIHISLQSIERTSVENRSKKGKSPLVIIEVTDNGKGIAKNRWKTVFDAGYTTKTRGWGLGLALVNRIVSEYHHGRIFVKESSVGVGTTFRIELF